MSRIYSHASDSYVTNATTDGSWNHAQGGATTDGAVQNSSALNSIIGVYAANVGSRGSDDYKCYRSYFVFGLGAESGTVDSATISIYMDNLGTSSGNSAGALIVEATALDDGVEDHGNVFSSGVTWHNDISDIISVSTTAGYHTFTMNSDGITLIQNAVGSGDVTVGLVSSHYDYGEQVPLTGGDYSQFRVWYSNTLGTSLDPKMDITYAAADNATFFGANF